MEKELFDDLVLSLNEAIEYEKGNLELKTTILEIPDNENDIISKYNQLPEDVKHSINIIIDRAFEITMQNTR